MSRRARTLTLLPLVLLAGGCDADANDATARVTVYAAASTAPLVTAFAEAYEERAGLRVRCSFAASSTLARQIEEGAPADVFISADPRWMDHLEAADLIAAGRRHDLLANGLVLAVAADAAPAAMVDLAPGASLDAAPAGPGRIAIGDPDHVPVGRYAREALVALGWWDDLAPRLVPANDARAVVRLLQIGEVDAAIVYASDAAGADDIAAAARFAPGTHAPIRYPVALCKGAGAAASEFLLALTSAETEPLRRSFGFTIPPETAGP